MKPSAPVTKTFLLEFFIIYFIFLIGDPIYVPDSWISSTTKEPLPMTTSLAIERFGFTNAPPPIKQLLPTFTPPANIEPGPI